MHFSFLSAAVFCFFRVTSFFFVSFTSKSWDDKSNLRKLSLMVSLSVSAVTTTWGDISQPSHTLLHFKLILFERIAYFRSNDYCSRDSWHFMQWRSINKVFLSQKTVTTAFFFVSSLSNCSLLLLFLETFCDISTKETQLFWRWFN